MKLLLLVPSLHLWPCIAARGRARRGSWMWQRSSSSQKGFRDSVSHDMYLQLGAGCSDSSAHPAPAGFAKNWMTLLHSRPYVNNCVLLNCWLSFHIDWLLRLNVELNKCFIPLWLTPLWYLYFQMSVFSKASYLPLIFLLQAFQKRRFESIWNVYITW